MECKSFPARLRGIAVLIVVGCAGLATRSAYAVPGGSFTFTIMPDGSGNIDVNGSGQFNLAGATADTGASTTASMRSAGPAIQNGPTSANYDLYQWTGATGPTNFGTGSSFTNATSGSGNLVGFSELGTTAFIFVPTGYTSSGALSDMSVYNSTTLADLGLTDGMSYQWTLQAGSVVNTLTINVVPEPATATLLALPAGLALLRRKRPHACGEL